VTAGDRGAVIFSYPDIVFVFTVHTDTVFVNIIHIFFFRAVKVLFCFDFSYRILEGGLGDREGVMPLFKFRYRTCFSFGGPLHFFTFDFVIGFWREGWGTGRVTVGDRGAWSFFLGLILFFTDTVHTDTVFVKVIHIFFFWVFKVLFCF